MKHTSRLLMGVLAVLATCIFAVPPSHAQNDGEQLYKAKCVACHAADGSGTPIGKRLGTHDLRSADVQKESDAELYDITAKGKGKMPAYAKSLSDSQIKSLVAYIRTLAKK